MVKVMDMLGRPVEVGDHVIFKPQDFLPFEVKEISEIATQIIAGSPPMQTIKLVCEYIMPLGGPVNLTPLYVVQKKAENSKISA